jgi:hypothetical protein
MKPARLELSSNTPDNPIIYNRLEIIIAAL